jgi:hypothetical protein
MTRHSTILALGLSALLLVACRDDSPIVSAEVRAPNAVARTLSARQVQTLNTWLEANRSGWSRLVLATPPPTFALSVTVHRQSGESGTIHFYSQEGWKGGLMYWGAEPSANRQGQYEAEEVIALRRELEKTQ